MNTIEFLFNKIYTAEGLIRAVNVENFLGHKVALVNGFPHAPSFENIVRLVRLSEDCQTRILVYPVDYAEGDPVPGFALMLAALYPVDGIGLVAEAEWDETVRMLEDKCVLIDFEADGQE
ncbi:hypothetical protein [Schleiferia thermophila]|jgi:hypothetical protein|uniref:hypothetical protein n=1 Tax=Schleiferia thermophila TaxID=884107 RepID=UPI002FD8B149